MSLKKIIGWILLVGGMAIILYSLYTSYLLFTAARPAPVIFRMEVATSTSSNFLPTDLTEKRITKIDLQQLVNSFCLGGSQSKLLNLIAWSIFAGILIFGGSQISGLGIKLIKK